LTPDNNSGAPDTFNHSDPNAVVFNGTTGSLHMLIQRGRTYTVHLLSNSNNVVVSSQSGNSVLLSSSNSTFVPFRMPAFALKDQTIKLTAEIYIIANAGAEGV